jgi:hypothetical protein
MRRTTTKLLLNCPRYYFKYLRRVLLNEKLFVNNIIADKTYFCVTLNMMMFLVVKAKSTHTILLVQSGFGSGRVSISVSFSCSLLLKS